MTEILVFWKAKNHFEPYTYESLNHGRKFDNFSRLSLYSD